MRATRRGGLLVSPLAVLMVSAIAAAGCDSTTEPRRESSPVRLEAVSATKVSATAGTELALPPTVRATDDAGRPVSGITVAFSLSSGGAVANTSAATDADGLASAGVWRLGHGVGTQLLTAHSPGANDVVFTATALPVRLEAVTPTELVGVVGAELPEAPAVRATDEAGRPVAGVLISFRPGSVWGPPSGSIARANVVTGEEGIASAGSWTLATRAGPQLLTASASGGVKVEFRATAEPGPVSQVTASSGGGQSSAVGRELPEPLLVRLADAFGNPVVGAAVTFTVTSGGGSLQFSSTMSDSDGRAVSGVWTLGPVAGVQQAVAEAGDVRVVFSSYACQACPEFLFVRNGAIYRGDGVGAAEVQLTPGTRDGQPAWSPDGQRIAFTRFSEPGVEIGADVYLMNADGSDVTRVTSGIVDSQGILRAVHSPSWSPDGRRLAVAVGDLYDGEIFLMDLTEADPTPVRLAKLAADPAWSPDGSRIAFVRLSGDDGYHALEMVSVDGSVVSQLVPADGSAFSTPTWSPDGQRIAFSRCSEGACDLFVVAADGSSPTRLTTGSASSVAWSPDGSRIGFTTWTAANDPAIAFVLVDGGTQAFTLMTNASGPSWRP